MAAQDFRRIDRGAPFANEVITYILALRQVRTLGEVLRSKLVHQFDDVNGENAIDWSLVETLYGLTPGQTSVGPQAEGALLFNRVNGSAGSLDGEFLTAAGKELTEMYG